MYGSPGKVERSGKRAASSTLVFHPLVVFTTHRVLFDVTEGGSGLTHFVCSLLSRHFTSATIPVFA